MKKRLIDALYAILVAVVILYLTAVAKGEQLRGLSYIDKLKTVLTTGVPLWVPLTLLLVAALTLWELYGKPKVRAVGNAQYYFKRYSNQPHCQPCYDDKGKLVQVSQLQDYENGTGRQCSLCRQTFFESHMPPEPPRRRDAVHDLRDAFRGSDGWMQ